MPHALGDRHRCPQTPTAVSPVQPSTHPSAAAWGCSPLRIWRYTPHRLPDDHAQEAAQGCPSLGGGIPEDQRELGSLPVALRTMVRE